ncbi:lysophospholipid acyltransferase family protein [Oryzibacter oryziterrae]|uniref:lysophospholipid acyltransferase family protein n=1 Tax=Oryzibacter oryziterrae TaxID=2766474 RepID=UPI001F16B706|nr:DUF374 domain-containing protein [Oryzibacter oryziterrae]
MRLDRRLLSFGALHRLVGRLVGAYARLVYTTAKMTVEPADAFAAAHRRGATIFAFWHGLALMSPAARPEDLPTAIMIARNAAAGIGAVAAETQGIGTIRASGSHNARAARRKGGSVGYRQALRELSEGRCVMMTADVPKISQVAGRGIVHLARSSGCPILPVAYVSRRAIRLSNWDRMSIDLPFSRAAVVHGAPIDVPKEATDADMERIARQLSAELDRTTQRAYEILGIAHKFHPGPRHDG